MSEQSKKSTKSVKSKQPDKAEARNKGGRPAIVIDVEILEKLAGLLCTYDDAARWFGCSRETIKRRMRVAKFREAWEHGRAKARVELRRSQFKLSETNASMAIFLGKQYLGQRDETTRRRRRWREGGRSKEGHAVTHVPANGGPIRVNEAKREFLRRIERIRAGEADRETE